MASAGAVVALRAARSLVSPPLATDSLTYHLFRAGRWVQSGERVLEPAPDAWGYYAYYPHIGDGLTAWLMLPT